jgi:acetylornithine deacetylase/succinyl-diaminopimelate desuccinylase-like protein
MHVTFDEESGGELGPAWILAQRISAPDLAIGAGFTYAVTNAHSGCLHLEIEVLGVSAHAAKPYTGVDALECAAAILTALYAERPALAKVTSAMPGIGSPQITVGLIRGGINTNVVPDRVVLRLDRRMIPEEEPAEVEASLRQRIERAGRAVPRARVTIRRVLLARPLVPLPEVKRLVETLCRRATAILGEPVQPTGVPLYTDARHYAAAGVPIALYGAGPRTIEAANAHRADERVPLADLFSATEVVALSLFDLLSS